MRKSERKRKRRKEKEGGNEKINLLKYHYLHFYIRKLFEKNMPCEISSIQTKKTKINFAPTTH